MKILGVENVRHHTNYGNIFIILILLFGIFHIITHLFNRSVTYMFCFIKILQKNHKNNSQM